MKTMETDACNQDAVCFGGKKIVTNAREECARRGTRDYTVWILGWMFGWRPLEVCA